MLWNMCEPDNFLLYLLQSFEAESCTLGKQQLVKAITKRVTSDRQEMIFQADIPVMDKIDSDFGNALKPQHTIGC